jgi:hypothetical protein
MRIQSFVVASMLAVANLAHAGVVAGEAADPATGAAKAEGEQQALARTHESSSSSSSSSSASHQRSGLENMRGGNSSMNHSAASSYTSHSASRSVHGIR